MIIPISSGCWRCSNELECWVCCNYHWASPWGGMSRPFCWPLGLHLARSVSFSDFSVHPLVGMMYHDWGPRGQGQHAAQHAAFPFQELVKVHHIPCWTRCWRTRFPWRPIASQMRSPLFQITSRMSWNTCLTFKKLRATWRTGASKKAWTGWPFICSTPSSHWRPTTARSFLPRRQSGHATKSGRRIF